MGNNDLKEIDQGTMDPSGRGSTNGGKICGMISTILGCLCLGGYGLLFGIAAASGGM